MSADTQGEAVDLDKLAAFVAAIELVNIRVEEFHGKLGKHGEIEKVNFDVSHSTSLEPERFQTRHEWVVLMLTDQDEVVADLGVSIVTVHDVAPGSEISPDVAEIYAATTGHFAAYPYAREALQSFSGRLQLPELVLGLLQRGTNQPRSISLSTVTPSTAP
jgi:hypothetical protein